jgi:hypothetical protein
VEAGAIDVVSYCIEYLDKLAFKKKMVNLPITFVMHWYVLVNAMS